MIKEKLRSLFVIMTGYPRMLTRKIIKKLLIEPDFIIIGTQKSGTTSLYNYLRMHPCILPSFRKEVHFFDVNYKKGLTWYKANFPTKLLKNIKKWKCKNAPVLTGEATPYYIFHPYALERIKKHFPNVKLILLLRNPVYRTVSHYNHEFSGNLENLSLKEALVKEEERLQDEIQKMNEDEHYYSFSHQHHSYLSSSRYAEQVERLLKLFPKEQILILKSETFFEKTKEEYKKVLDFLGLPEWYPKEFRVFYQNKKISSKLDNETRKMLEQYFAPHNKKLYELIGEDFNW